MRKLQRQVKETVEKGSGKPLVSHEKPKQSQGAQNTVQFFTQERQEGFYKMAERVSPVIGGWGLPSSLSLTNIIPLQ